jgi:hypothetical protein
MLIYLFIRRINDLRRSIKRQLKNPNPIMDESASITSTEISPSSVAISRLRRTCSSTPHFQTAKIAPVAVAIAMIQDATLPLPVDVP